MKIAIVFIALSSVVFAEHQILEVKESDDPSYLTNSKLRTFKRSAKQHSGEINWIELKPDESGKETNEQRAKAKTGKSSFGREHVKIEESREYDLTKSESEELVKMTHYFNRFKPSEIIAKVLNKAKQGQSKKIVTEPPLTTRRSIWRHLIKPKPAKKEVTVAPLLPAPKPKETPGQKLDKFLDTFSSCAKGVIAMIESFITCAENFSLLACYNDATMHLLLCPIIRYHI